MTDYDDWQWQQQADEEAVQQAGIEALKASATRPLAEEEQAAIAWCAGFPSTSYREIQR